LRRSIGCVLLDAKKLAAATGYGVLGPVGVALGILYNAYEITKLALVLGPIVTDLMNRGIDYFVFDSYSDRNAKRFYMGSSDDANLFYTWPGFFQNNDKGVRKPEDLFPAFPTPDELMTAIQEEWENARAFSHGANLFGDLTIEKMKTLALNDWKKSFALKLNEFLKQAGADTPQDEDVTKFESTSIETTNTNWSDAYSQTSAVITGLELDPEEPEAGEDIDLNCEYVVFGLPGQNVFTKLVLRVISPLGEEEQVEESETLIDKDVADVEERAKFVSVNKTFILDENIDLSRTTFVAELYDMSGRRIDKLEIRTVVIPTEIEVKTRTGGSRSATQ